VARAFGLTRWVVELGVLSALAFSLMLFVAAAAQAYRSVLGALGQLGERETTKGLLIAAVEHADTLLVGLGLLLISLGMQALFIGRLDNVPGWLRVGTFDDLKHKLLAVVVTALAVGFFAVALDWKGGTDILAYGLAVSAVILSITVYLRGGVPLAPAPADPPGEERPSEEGEEPGASGP